MIREYYNAFVQYDDNDKVVDVIWKNRVKP